VLENNPWKKESIIVFFEQSKAVFFTKEKVTLKMFYVFLDARNNP
jgi:hypothetical protein